MSSGNTVWLWIFTSLIIWFPIMPFIIWFPIKSQIIWFPVKQFTSWRFLNKDKIINVKNLLDQVIISLGCLKTKVAHHKRLMAEMLTCIHSTKKWRYYAFTFHSSNEVERCYAIVDYYACWTIHCFCTYSITTELKVLFLCRNLHVHKRRYIKIIKIIGSWHSISRSNFWNLAFLQSFPNGST